MDEARPIIEKVAEATVTVRSTLDALERLLSVLHDDNYVSVDEAREVRELTGNLVWDARDAKKIADAITFHALMQREEETP